MKPNDINNGRIASSTHKRPPAICNRSSCFFAVRRSSGRHREAPAEGSKRSRAHTLTSLVFHQCALPSPGICCGGGRRSGCTRMRTALSGGSGRPSSGDPQPAGGHGLVSAESGQRECGCNRNRAHGAQANLLPNAGKGGRGALPNKTTRAGNRTSGPSSSLADDTHAHTTGRCAVPPHLILRPILRAHLTTWWWRAAAAAASETVARKSLRHRQWGWAG
jgi:hypothetical protein